MSRVDCAWGFGGRLVNLFFETASCSSSSFSQVWFPRTSNFQTPQQEVPGGETFCVMSFSDYGESAENFSLLERKLSVILANYCVYDCHFDNNALIGNPEATTARLIILPDGSRF